LKSPTVPGFQKFHMRATGVVFAILVLARSARFQSSQLKSQKLYFLRDDSAKQWCAYTSESEKNSEFGRLRSVLDGEVAYTNDVISRVVFTLNSVSGDWDVQDELILDNDEKFQNE
jgi:hypothetical protein